MSRKPRLRSSALTLALAGWSALSTSALVAQIVEDPVEENAGEAIDMPEDVGGEQAPADVPEHEGEEEDGMHRGEKPLRIRQEERDALKAQNRQQEEVGRLIELQVERALDLGEEIPDFEVMKEQANAQLFQASEKHGMRNDVPMGGEHRVCFRPDGSVTDLREECDPDQSRHFGVQEASPVGGQEESGYAPVSDESMQEHMEERFGQPEFGSADLAGVVGEALERLSAMMGQLQGNPAAMFQIQETIAYLSDILRQQSAGQVPSEDAREQIRMRLEKIMQAVAVHGGSAGMHPGQGGFGPPDMSRVLAMMEKMIPKLPQVIAIFEEEGIPVDPDARAAAQEAVDAFARLKEPCGAGDMNACMELGRVMSGIDSRIRPPMEAAMMASGNPEAVMRIEAFMSEGMEGMDMDERGSMPGEYHRGPPDGGAYEFRGPPSGMQPPQGFGAPNAPGYRQGPPPGFDPSAYPQGMPGGYDFRGPPPPGMPQYGQPPQGFGAPPPQEFGHPYDRPPEGFDPSAYPQGMPEGMEYR